MCRILFPMLIVLALAAICHAADPVVSSVTTIVEGNEHITTVDVTFTFSDADGDDSHVALFGHDASNVPSDPTYAATGLIHFPMVTFLGGNGPHYLQDETFGPGTHTVTWVASADTSADFTSNDFTVYVQVSDSGRIAPGQYLVIDVSGGTGASSYPVGYMPYVDVTQDAYKTDKIVLRGLPDGSYAGVYEVTQRQYELVTGATPSSFGGNPMRPVERVSWDDITGSGGYASGFIAMLRSKAGLSTLDLPTYSSAWETACRAGTTYYYNDYTQNRGKGDSTESTLENLGWYDINSASRTHDAGEKQPNAWGLYDMHGNVSEWTLPTLPPPNDHYYIKGGAWSTSAGMCRSYSNSE